MVLNLKNGKLFQVSCPEGYIKKEYKFNLIKQICKTEKKISSRTCTDLNSKTEDSTSKSGYEFIENYLNLRVLANDVFLLAGIIRFHPFIAEVPVGQCEP